MATIQQVVNEWQNRRNKYPLLAWDKNHPGMQLAPLKKNNPQVIGSGKRHKEPEQWASIKLSQNTTTDGRKWLSGGSNTACYYFSEFNNRFEVGLRIGSKSAKGCNIGSQGLFNSMQQLEQQLNAQNNSYKWGADKTQYETIRLISIISKSKNAVFICDCMEYLIQSTQSTISKIIP